MFISVGLTSLVILTQIAPVSLQLQLHSRLERPSLQLNTIIQQRIIQKWFGDFFRTPQEQSVYEKKIISRGFEPVENWDELREKLNYNFSETHKLEGSTSRKRRNAQNGVVHYLNEPPIYHGCCKSRRKFISPPKAVCEDTGQMLTLIHMNQIKRRQYFLSMDCSHDDGCSLHCQCGREYAVYRAVVALNYYPYGAIRSILLHGCCKCFNV